MELLRQVIEQEDGDVISQRQKRSELQFPQKLSRCCQALMKKAIVKLLLKAAPQSVSTQTVMSISKKKFELMDALRNLEKNRLCRKVILENTH